MNRSFHQILQMLFKQCVLPIHKKSVFLPCDFINKQNLTGGRIMYLSDYIKESRKGHANFDFVDVQLDSDNRIFIDPVVLEGATDEWSINANRCVQSFFNCLFTALKNNQSDKLFDHAHEQNATKFGYGNGKNGKGKTADGLEDALGKLKALVHMIPTISKGEDIPVLVEGFAEDCMSDLLTNILHEQLNEFTALQMESRGIPADGTKTFWTWDMIAHTWHQVTKKSWFYNGKELLMVPKWIVRRNYLFKAHQYLYGVIIERMQIENGWKDMKKVDVLNNMPKDKEHWEYETVIQYTKENPEALDEYHKRIPKYYNRARGIMSDEELDIAIYGFKIEEVA